MNDLMRLCSALMDELNEVFADRLKSCTHQHPVVSSRKDAGLVLSEDVSLKNRILSCLKQCFIDTAQIRLRECELALFCANEGYETVTRHVSDTRVCFYLRADAFDMVVEYER